MNHYIVLPLLVSLMTGALVILSSGHSIARQRTVSLGGSLLLILVTGFLLFQSVNGPVQVYVMGNWIAPFGIVMVLDRLSAMMIFVTSLLAFLCLVYAIQGTDTRGKNFHALFQFQILGINGAFLTGDLFNLFVCFEIMLLSSYGLVLHGGGGLRTRAGMHYAMLNLIGSSIFLIGVGILYGVLGTLNMADMAVRITSAPAENAALIQAGGLILFGVFALKAALLPLYFWLPDSYGFTSAPVAALFAVMTKVGIYAILRVYTLMFGDHAGVSANLLSPWLLPIALLTLMAGVAGMIASQDLRRTTAFLVIVSVGTLLAVIGTFQAEAIAAAIVYLPHSTFLTAAMFVTADMIGCQRPTAGTRLIPDIPLTRPTLLGLLFLGTAVAIAGLPPLSGFTAKVMMLMAVLPSPGSEWIWFVVLFGGFLSLIALGRAGSVIFWKTLPLADTGLTGSVNDRDGNKLFLHGPVPYIPAFVLLGISPLLVFFGHPISQFAQTMAHQLMAPGPYIEAVLGTDVLTLFLQSTGGL